MSDEINELETQLRLNEQLLKANRSKLAHELSRTAELKAKHTKIRLDRQILELLAAGLDCETVAHNLNVSPRRVRVVFDLAMDELNS